MTVRQTSAATTRGPTADNRRQNFARTNTTRTEHGAPASSWKPCRHPFSQRPMNLGTLCDPGQSRVRSALSRLPTVASSPFSYRLLVDEGAELLKRETHNRLICMRL